MKYGKDLKSSSFRPGLNWLSTLGALCISYSDRQTGECVNTFVVEAGTHLLRVPGHCTVDVECHDKVGWQVQNYDPLEHPDQTPHELTVVRPRSWKDEMKEYAYSLVAKLTGATREEIETAEDAADFDVDDDDGAPLTLHEIRAMDLEGNPDARQIEDDPDPDPLPIDPAEPSPEPGPSEPPKSQAGAPPKAPASKKEKAANPPKAPAQ